MIVMRGKNVLFPSTTVLNEALISGLKTRNKNVDEVAVCAFAVFSLEIATGSNFEVEPIIIVIHFSDIPVMLEKPSRMKGVPCVRHLSNVSPL